MFERSSVTKCWRNMENRFEVTFFQIWPEQGCWGNEVQARKRHHQIASYILGDLVRQMKILNVATL